MHSKGQPCHDDDPLPLPLLMGVIRFSHLWSTIHLLRLSGQQSVTPARYAHKSMGENVVRMWVRLKRVCVTKVHKVMDVIWRRLCVSMI